MTHVPGRPLRVVVAPDSFGGALDSVAAASAIADGWRRVRPDDEVALRPMADGGEETLAAIAAALGDTAERRSVETTDALGRPVAAEWLIIDGGRAAFVEMAAASGLARLAPEERTPENARRASTRGTGLVVRAALDAGVERLTIGLGGSATTDGGSGLLRELGLTLLGDDGDELPDGGAALAGIGPGSDTANLDPRLRDVAIVVASDVRNPLCGPRGAAATYGPQKGADPDAVAELDAALASWGRFIERTTGRLVADLPGSGAAGGTTAGLLGLTRAVVRPGVEVVAELVKLAEALDAATALTVVQPIVDRPTDLASAMADTDRLLRAAAGRLARSVGIGLELSRA